MRGYTVIELIVVVGIALVALMMVASFLSGRRDYNNYMRECMRDGHKEYECRILLSYRSEP